MTHWLCSGDQMPSILYLLPRHPSLCVLDFINVVLASPLLKISIFKVPAPAKILALFLRTKLCVLCSGRSMFCAPQVLSSHHLLVPGDGFRVIYPSGAQWSPCFPNLSIVAETAR